MPIYPRVSPQFTQQVLTDSFGGYDHRLKIPDGEFYDTKNLTTDHAPMLANRRPRGDLKRGAVALAEKKSLAYVGTDGTLYFNFLPTGLTGLSPGEKQLVSMGAYLVVFPDKKYINTEELSDYGSLEAHYSAQSAAYRMVRWDGTAVNASHIQAAAPAEPANGEYWIDTSGETHVLRQWSDAQADWLSVETVYIKISFPTLGTIPALFSEADGVTISGSSIDEVNGEKVICALGGRAAGANDAGEADWIMVTGLLGQAVTDGGLSIDRSVPSPDHVCECQNRLWGCRYGMADGQTVNEIFCCALGDFKNWRQYQGLSTDSWTGSVGSDGPWTGAVNYLGYPTFFKENRIHRVTISTEGAHRIDETVCRGVQKGSAKSLVVVNETLYYKSGSDVCAYQGGFPTGISAALGDAAYHDAAAGAVGGKYYISMLDENNAASLFVYDIAKGVWIREDELRVTAFARVDNELFAVASNGLRTMLGSLCGVSGAEKESGMTWEAVTGVQYYELPENKRVSRYNVRMKMARGARMEAFVQYDSDGVWRSAGSVTAGSAGTDSYLFPIRPHRCDHLQLKLSGSGDVRIFSIAKILEVGSDYR